MNRKTLSVSIAAYNISDYIKKTLDFLLVEETYRDKLDVIIVNDGSKDDTLKIVEDYSARFPNCIQVINKNNGGYGSTINSSLAIAKGTYFKLLDGDDWFDKKELRGLIDYLETVESDLIISPYYEVTNKKTWIAHYPDIPKAPSVIANLKLNNKFTRFQMHGLTVRTETIRKFGCSITEKCFYTDFEFVFYCVMASKTISRCDNAVYCYRLGIEGQSVSLTGMRKHYLDYHVVAERVFQCYCDHVLKVHGTKKMILERSVGFYIYCIFNTYMLLENPEAHRKELIEFDEMVLKKYPVAWEAGTNSKIVYCVRKLRFHFYNVFCRYMLWKLIH